MNPSLFPRKDIYYGLTASAHATNSGRRGTSPDWTKSPNAGQSKKFYPSSKLDNGLKNFKKVSGEIASQEGEKARSHGHQIGRLYLLFILVFCLGGCVSARPIPVSKEPVTLTDLCAKYNIQWELDSVTHIVRLGHQGRSARVLIDSNLVLVDDKNITLSEPVKNSRGILVVPFDFKEKVVDELIQKIDHFIRKFRVVVIDAGHGGKDPGAIGRNGLHEKDVTLDIALRLRRGLEDSGIKVVMTRDSDEFISLEERTQIASRSQADLFISIHANSSRSRTARGFESYYLRETEYLKKRDDVLEKNFDLKKSQFSMEKHRGPLEDILLDMMLDYKQEESRGLADHIGKNTPDKINARTRGSKTAGFFVLRNTLIPAVLVEVGFLTNPHEEYLLNTSSYRNKMADGLAQSILEYANK